MADKMIKWVGKKNINCHQHTDDTQQAAQVQKPSLQWLRKMTNEQFK